MSDALAALGLQAGESVRFRRRTDQRWSAGKALGVETDGSIRLADSKGAVLSLPAASIEVRVAGRRGASKWEPLPDRAGRTEQLRLL